jgi:outer membrane receptor protein involved in Fe transport
MTKSFQHEPDLKYFAYTTVCEETGGEENCEYYINNAEYAFPYHFFRKLEDKNFEGKLDITIPFLNAVKPNEIKVGGYYSNANREFEEYRYQLNNSGVPTDLNFTNFGGDFNAFFNPSNFGIVDTLFKADGSIQRYVTGYHYINQINAKNFYTGEQQIASAYAMATMHIGDKLKAIGGVRIENTEMEVVSKDSTIEPGKISLTDPLSSLNFIYTHSLKIQIFG